jgi:hypothetical protein
MEAIQRERERNDIAKLEAAGIPVPGAKLSPQFRRDFNKKSALQKVRNAEPAAGVPVATTPGSGLPTGRSYTALVDDKGQTLSMRQAGTYDNSPIDMAEQDRMKMLSSDIAATTDPNKRLAMQMFGARQLGQSMSLSNPVGARAGSVPKLTRGESIALNRTAASSLGVPRDIKRQGPSQDMFNPQQRQRPWYLNV